MFLSSSTRDGRPRTRINALAPGDRRMTKQFIPLDHVFQGDDNALCGPASVKMVLSQSHSSTESLPSISSDTTIADPDWDIGIGSSPLGIKTAICNRTTGDHKTAASVQAFDDRDALTWRIRWSIDNRSVTPVVLVIASKHWLVVNGYVLDTSIQDSPASTESIRYLLISDPAIPFGGDSESRKGIIQAISRHEWDAVLLQKPYPRLKHPDGSETNYANRFIAVLDGDEVENPVVSSKPLE